MIRSERVRVDVLSTSLIGEDSHGSVINEAVSHRELLKLSLLFNLSELGERVNFLFVNLVILAIKVSAGETLFKFAEVLKREKVISFKREKERGECDSYLSSISIDGIL